jgi:putative hemolysin
LLLLLVLSALISGSEVAFFSFSLDERTRCRESEDRGERRIARLLDKPQLLLATILIFSNLVNITFITIAAYLAQEYMGLDTGQPLDLALLAFGVALLIVFFGELVPKVWASQNSLRFLRVTAPLIDLATVVFRPLSIPDAGHHETLSKKRVQRKGYTITAEELSHALEMTTGEDTSVEQKEILRGIVNFSSIAARQIMRSRMDITAFERDLDFHELMDKINKSGYSRVPVYRDSIDRIEGILYIKDLLPHLDKDEYFAWQELLRPPYFIPESKKIDDLLHDFQEKRVHMAVVVNEYGETEGLVTFEDIIEEIVGEINDEFDDEELNYSKLDANTYVFEGKTLLNDFAKALDIDLDLFDRVRGESESLGGLLLELFGRLPKSNEETKYDAFTFRVLSVDTKRIKKVRVTVQREEEKKEEEPVKRIGFRGLTGDTERDSTRKPE